MLEGEKLSWPVVSGGSVGDKPFLVALNSPRVPQGPDLRPGGADGFASSFSGSHSH